MSAFTIGPGELEFGSAGGARNFTVQITAAQVDWEVDAEDDIPHLGGGVVAGEETNTATLTGNLLQDISESGISTWTWENKGQVLPVTYTPNTGVGRAVIGSVKIRPTTVGGEVKTKARADFEFPFVGEPALADVEA